MKLRKTNKNIAKRQNKMRKYERNFKINYKGNKLR